MSRRVDDDEDLLGTRPKSRTQKALDALADEFLPEPEETVQHNAVEQSTALDINDVYRGVSVTWLMRAFRMDRNTVKKKIADLDPLKYASGNVPIYDFVQAAGYLVKPKVNIADYIKKMRPDELPNDLQKDFWDAKLKMQRYKAQAGELWHTADVMLVIGEMLSHIRSSTQLWVSNLERTQGLTPEQYKTLEQLSDQLLADIHERLVEMKEGALTESSLADENDV